jgi:uncharacterized protein
MAARDERPAFSFIIHELDDGPKTYDEVIEHAFIEGALAGEDEFRAAEGSGALHVTLTKMGREILAVGTAKAAFVAPCARCLREAHIAVVGEIEAIAIPAGAAAAPPKPSKGKAKEKGAGDKGAPAKKAAKAPKRDDDLDDEDDLVDDGPDTIRYEGEHLVLDDVVRDALVLEIPMMPLCSEACPGIERPPLVESEADRPIDPRFAALLSVKPGSKA